MITKEYIENLYAEVLRELSEKHPVELWKVEPSGLKFTDEKTKFGMARFDGVIFINTAFIGTEAKAKLNNTMRHEFAHLAAGLNNNHNKVFKRFARFFGCNPDIDLSEEIRQVIGKIDYKYMLVAHTSDGGRHEIGGAHRKSKKYANFGKALRERYSYEVNGLKVVRFVYEPQK